MLKLLSKGLDRGVIWSASRFAPGGCRAPHHASEAEKWLQDPGFFSDLSGEVPDLSFSSQIDFQFPSTITSPWAQNNRVRGKVFRAGADWRDRPSVILLHGWNAEGQYRYQFPRIARKLARAGVNAAMFELPYHCHRTPTEPGAIQNFISHDLLHMLEATRQSLADARGLLAWLKAQGSPVVGLWGISLGAWLAGLLTAFEERARFAVLQVPIAKVDRAIADLGFCASIRGSLESTSLRLDPLNLASHIPLLLTENILIVESKFDVFAPAETVEELWQAWKEPEIWRLRHGHISILLSPFVPRRIVRWIRAKTLGLLLIERQEGRIVD